MSEEAKKTEKKAAEKEKLTPEEKLEKRLLKVHEKQSELKKKEKELEKKRRAKEKERVKKEKAEAEAKAAKTNEIVVKLACMWHGCETEKLIEEYSKAIVSKYPDLKERVDEIINGKVDGFGK